MRCERQFPKEEMNKYNQILSELGKGLPHLNMFHIFSMMPFKASTNAISSPRMLQWLSDWGPSGLSEDLDLLAAI